MSYVNTTPLRLRLNLLSRSLVGNKLGVIHQELQKVSSRIVDNNNKYNQRISSIDLSRIME